MPYNIQVLSYLIGSFTEMVATFGDTPNTAKCFKNQAVGLVRINQLAQKDLNFVLKLLDIKESNQFDWKKVQQRVTMFNSAMNIMLNTEASIRPMAAYELKQTKQINAFVYERLCEVWEIPKYDNVLPTLNPKKDDKGFSFGNLTGMIPTTDIEGSWTHLIKLYGDKYLRIRNPNAVCSGDPLYLQCLVKNIKNKEAKNILDHIRMGTPFEIVEEKTESDGCHTSHSYTRVAQADELAHSLDFNNIDFDSSEKKPIKRSTTRDTSEKKAISYSATFDSCSLGKRVGSWDRC